MGELRVIRSGIFALAAIVAWHVSAQRPEFYGQWLVEQIAAKHPEIRELSLYARVHNGDAPTVVASTADRIGTRAGADQSKALETGQAVFTAHGDRLTVDLQLHDVSKRPIGILEVVLPYRPADDRSALLETAASIRDGLARRLPQARSLMEPVQFDSSVPTKTYAQALVDETLAANPEIIVMALQATPPSGGKDVIVASNIGRIGKRADSGDLSVIATGTPKLAVNETGDRFEVEMQLHDQSGKTVGALSTVYAYKPSDDRDMLRQKSEVIRAMIEKRIPSAEKLFEAS